MASKDNAVYAEEDVDPTDGYYALDRVLCCWGRVCAHIEAKYVGKKLFY